MKPLPLLLFLCFVAGLIHGQPPPEIKGRVFDKDSKRPIKGLSVYIDHDKVKTFIQPTNDIGEFIYDNRNNLIISGEPIFFSFSNEEYNSTDIRRQPEPNGDIEHIYLEKLKSFNRIIKGHVYEFKGRKKNKTPIDYVDIFLVKSSSVSDTVKVSGDDSGNFDLVATVLPQERATLIISKPGSHQDTKIKNVDFSSYESFLEMNVYLRQKEFFTTTRLLFIGGAAMAIGTFIGSFHDGPLMDYQEFRTMDSLNEANKINRISLATLIFGGGVAAVGIYKWVNEKLGLYEIGASSNISVSLESLYDWEFDRNVLGIGLTFSF